MNQVVIASVSHVTTSSQTTHLPEELAQLMAALNGCCHPRAHRLQLQIQTLEPHDQEALHRIQADARHLLYLSFGTNEANRRLRMAYDALQ